MLFCLVILIYFFFLFHFFSFVTFIYFSALFFYLSFFPLFVYVLFSKTFFLSFLFGFFSPPLFFYVLSSKTSLPLPHIPPAPPSRALSSGGPSPTLYLCHFHLFSPSFLPPPAHSPLVLVPRGVSTWITNRPKDVHKLPE